MSRKFWILLFACASMFALGLGDNIRGPLFPELLNAFNISNTKGSASYALTTAFVFVGNVTSHSILKLFRINHILMASILMMFLGLAGMGLASNFNLYLLAAALFGLSIGYMSVAQNLMVAENFNSSEQSKALSGLHGIYGFSSFLAPLLAASSTAHFQTWQSGFVAASLIALFVFMLSFVISPSDKVDHKVDSEQLVQVETTEVKKSIKSYLTLGGFLGFYVVAELLVSTRLALYMRQYNQMNLEQSSHYVTYFFIFLLLGRIVFTLKTFSVTIKNQLNLMLLGTTFTMVLGLFVHPFFLVLTGLTMAAFYPMSLAYISEVTAQKKRSYITFAIAFQSFLIIAMHVGVGWLTDTFGLNRAFYVGIVTLLIAMLCLNFHPTFEKESPHAV